MARSPPLAALLVAFLVVLAGCPGLTGGNTTPDQTEAGTPTDTPASPETAPATPTAASTPADGSTREPTDGSTVVDTPTTTGPPTPTDAPTPGPTDDGGTTDRPTPTPTDRLTPPPTDDGTPTPTHESAVGDSELVEVDGTLPVNATVVYRRTERLLGVDAPAPSIELTDVTPPESQEFPTSPATEALGYGNETGPVGDCAPLTNAFAGGDEVTLAPRNLSAAALELVLAHEYTHILQDEVENFSDADARATRRALIEGSAVYVAETYAREYDKRWAGLRPLELRECMVEKAQYRARSLSAEYYYGGFYFQRVIDHPTALPEVFSDSPRTTEQLIHAETPDSEPPQNLSVTAESSESWDARAPDRWGELSLRTWLATGLSEERVDAAATGWGNGSLVQFRGEGRSVGLAVVLRWDTRAEADEFAAALADLETALEGRNATHVRGVRVGEDTVVAFAGPEPFVANASATGATGNVTVSAP